MQTGVSGSLHAQTDLAGDWIGTQPAQLSGVVQRCRCSVRVRLRAHSISPAQSSSSSTPSHGGGDGGGEDDDDDDGDTLLSSYIYTEELEAVTLPCV